MTSHCRAWVVILSIWAASVVVPASSARAQSVQPAVPDREIVQLQGNLYEARTDTQYTVFLVTPDGIVLGDPISTAFAFWLKEQFALRFPGLGVRYVVFTHHHFDRSEGGTVFERATFIAQRRFNDLLSEARRSLPAFVDVSDTNNNGQFDPDELRGRADAPLLLSRDRNGDGTVTRPELYDRVTSVIDRFGARRTITLGNQRVEVVHTGDWHSPDMAALFFPEQRIVFAVDPPPITTVPFAFGSTGASPIYAWLRAIAPLDFDTVILGDGRTISRADVEALSIYLEALHADVARAFERRRSLRQIEATPIPEQYRGSPHYANRQAQIAAVYRSLHFQMFELSAAGVVHDVRRDFVCASGAFCTGGGAVRALTGGASFMLSRTMGLAAEALFGDQLWGTVIRKDFQGEFALRQARGALLFRYTPVASITATAGPSVTFGDVRGMAIQQGVVGFGGRYPIQQRASQLGVTAGFDLRLPLRGGISVVAPVRVNMFNGTAPSFWPGHTAVTAGVGLSVRLARHAG